MTTHDNESLKTDALARRNVKKKIDYFAIIGMLFSLGLAAAYAKKIFKK